MNISLFLYEQFTAISKIYIILGDKDEVLS